MAGKKTTKPTARKEPKAGKAQVNALTPRQQCFVDEYLVDLNGTQAAIRSGYSARTANEQAARLLAKASVAAAVKEAMKSREQRTQITQDRVLQELARIAFFDIRKLYNSDGSMKLPTELDDDAAAVLSGIDVTETGGIGDDVTQILTKKAKVFDKGSALTLAMRHLGMLTDKVEHSGGIAVTAVDMTPEERAARIAKLYADNPALLALARKGPDRG